MAALVDLSKNTFKILRILWENWVWDNLTGN